MDSSKSALSSAGAAVAQAQVPDDIRAPQFESAIRGTLGGTPPDATSRESTKDDQRNARSVHNGTPGPHPTNVEKGHSTAQASSRDAEAHVKQDAPSLGKTLSHFVEACDDRWVLEMSGFILAMACLLAVVAILAANQDEPLPSSPDAISINSWISIFTAVMKAAVVLPVSEGISQMKWLWFVEPRPLIHMKTFDAASRSPWGALWLLLASFRGHHIASFGAFISILAMAIDPFSQQIIQYYSCFQVSPDKVAVIPKTNNYTENAIGTRPGNAELNLNMSNAILLGTLDAINGTALIPFSCSSGNCTFPNTEDAAFQTIGMCSSCKDASYLIRSNDSFAGYWLDNWTPEPSWQWADRPAYVGYAFPNSSTNTPYSMLWSRKTLALSPEFDDLLTFDALMLNIEPSCVPDATRSCPTHPWAVRCSIFPCIKTYSTSIVNSVLTETVLSTTPLRKTNASAIEVTTSTNLTFSLATDTILQNGTWTQCNVLDRPSKDTPVAVGRNGTLISNNPNPGSPLRYYPNDCIWNLGYVIALGLNQYMSWMWDDDTNNYLEAFSEDTLDTQGPQMLKMLYRNGSATLDTVNQYVDGITSTITAIMRQSGESGPPQWAYGTVLEAKTCIGVQWPWLTLPVLLFLSSVAFFVATTVCSVRAGMWTGAWRSSAVAPFLVGMNTNSDDVNGGTGRNSELESLATNVHMKVSMKTQRLTVFPSSSAN